MAESGFVAAEFCMLLYLQEAAWDLAAGSPESLSRNVAFREYKTTPAPSPKEHFSPFLFTYLSSLSRHHRLFTRSTHDGRPAYSRG